MGLCGEWCYVEFGVLGLCGNSLVAMCGESLVISGTVCYQFGGGVAMCVDSLVIRSTVCKQFGGVWQL